ncbi:hypothetical protein HSBAA_61930 [Vreelandella sulfidaeris]|uniref:Uncharacterized protein n=1 Tax=Vreelandella sulfidaeris TaxID=115553 RepID=A0A455UGM7_9GAMM|nr:hypothetical protein HSBAA_61930 [Halomonas sulfidaeris]
MLKSGNPISLTTGDDFQALNAEQLELAERVGILTLEIVIGRVFNHPGWP